VDASPFQPGGERSSCSGPAADSSLFETFRQVFQFYDLTGPTLISALMHCTAQCCGDETFSFGSDSGPVEPQIRIAVPAPDPATAQDRFIRYLENWLFLT
jgi:hypothetical protein